MYLAEHNKLKDYRAIKCISKTRSTPPSLLQEADLLKNLRHPGIPIIYDVEEDNEYYYIVEEYVQGLSLLRYFEEEQEVSQEVILDFAIQLCDILDYLHLQKPQPIFYLDLKPEHIILSGGQLKLIDFGMATIGCRKENTVGFTCEFAAPEKYSGKDMDCRTDIYELGSVLFYLIFHQYYPGKSKKYPPRRKVISKKLEKILIKMLQENPNKRYQSIQALRMDLLKLKHHGSEGRHLKKDIFIMGCAPRVGTTHIAISLVSYLNKQQSDSAVYVEENSSGLLRMLMETFMDIKESGGIIFFDHFVGIPQYGESFQVEVNAPLQVKDYGTQRLRLCMSAKDEAERELLIYVMDGSCWLWSKAAEELKELEEMFEVKVVLNSEDAVLKKRLENYLKKDVLSFNRQSNPFYLSKQRVQFWESFKKGGIVN
ncbi:serine/threonine protein kinase [Eubacterium oxidoreducens]|uniref:non-specific serine/threonine protein kinase n=1 Tax=Eubacterium oxidoreducens TaxID=1732 RepID=A0A1G6A030_EUBOX|nr:serine/threonine protein kinase [Eubacterium oxidoreducens]